MNTDLKVLMISSDRKLLEEGSAVSARLKEYGALVQELHIVLLSDRGHGLKETRLGENVWVYPTNSLSKFLRPRDASKLGKRIVLDKRFVRGKSLITTQDPFECGLVGLKIKRKWRIPLEVQLHTDPFSGYFSGFLNKLRKRIAKKVLLRADGVRVVTEYLKAKIAPLTSAEVSVLPIFIDKSRIENAQIAFDLHGRHNWRFIMLSVGRLAPEKNLSMALEILARVREKFKDAGLVLVGSGPEEEKLKALVQRLGLERHVAFEGWQENLASYYKTADLYLQTSLFEGYGLSLLEAGLSGLSIVTTPVGVASELSHGQDAYIYPQGDIESFSSGILELINNREKREFLHTNLKHTLAEKLISKEDYLTRMQSMWLKVASKI